MLFLPCDISLKTFLTGPGEFSRRRRKFTKSFTPSSMEISVILVGKDSRF